MSDTREEKVSDTVFVYGAYCRARAKIAWQAVRDICVGIAESAEALFDDRHVE
ncbi:MAG: hypothetical protein AAF483_26630 [Planctomycetota bacterium]